MEGGSSGWLGIRVLTGSRLAVGCSRSEEEGLGRTYALVGSTGGHGATDARGVTRSKERKSEDGDERGEWEKGRRRADEAVRYTGRVGGGGGGVSGG